MVQLRVALILPITDASAHSQCAVDSAIFVHRPTGCVDSFHLYLLVGFMVVAQLDDLASRGPDRLGDCISLEVCLGLLGV